MSTHASSPRQEAFHSCGSNLWVQRSTTTDDVRIVANLCHDRMCVPCQNARALRIRTNLHKLIKEQQTRFLTLTLRHSLTPLRDQITRLYRSFHELKRREIWSSNVTAGVAFLEVKVSARDQLWHVHLHVLATGTFINQRELSNAWHAVTGDSSIVDIRLIRNPLDASIYVTKYVTKPADSSVFDTEDRLQEFILAVKGRRLYNIFGDWRHQKLDQPVDADTEWANVESVAHLLQSAHDGNLAANVLLERLEKKYPQLKYLNAPERAPPKTDA